MKITYYVAFVAALATVGISWNAEALCNQSVASQADRDLWKIHGCRPDFYYWQTQVYDLRWADWIDRGWHAACNNTYEFPKHWNASFLVTYRLLDNNNQSFHGTSDYRALAEAAQSEFHDDFYHVPSDRT